MLSYIFLPSSSIILKIDHMILLWLNAVPDSKMARLEEPAEKVRRSLEGLLSLPMVLYIFLLSHY